MDIINQQREWEVGKDFEIKGDRMRGSYGKVCEAISCSIYRKK